MKKIGIPLLDDTEDWHHTSWYAAAAWFLWQCSFRRDGVFHLRNDGKNAYAHTFDVVPSVQGFHFIHVHHYIFFSAFVPLAATDDHFSAICQGVVIGMSIQGVAQYGPASLWTYSPPDNYWFIDCEEHSSTTQALSVIRWWVYVTVQFIPVMCDSENIIMPLSLDEGTSARLFGMSRFVSSIFLSDIVISLSQPVISLSQPDIVTSWPYFSDLTSWYRELILAIRHDDILCVYRHLDFRTPCGGLYINFPPCILSKGIPPLLCFRKAWCVHCCASSQSFELMISHAVLFGINKNCSRESGMSALCRIGLLHYNHHHPTDAVAWSSWASRLLGRHEHWMPAACQEGWKNIPSQRQAANFR